MIEEKISKYGVIFIRRLWKAFVTLLLLAVIFGIVAGGIEYFADNIKIAKTIGIVILSIAFLFGVGTLIERIENKK